MQLLPVIGKHRRGELYAVGQLGWAGDGRLVRVGLQMTLFTNPNFIDCLIKAQGGDRLIPQHHYPALQMLVELETRLLLENAIKFMRRDRRHTLTPHDMALAAQQLTHSEMVLYSQPSRYVARSEQAHRLDYTHASPEDHFEETMKKLSTITLDAPKMRGQWVYIDGRIPNTPENHHLRTLEQLESTREHQKEEQRKLFNIIKEDANSVLTLEEEEYFRRVAGWVENDQGPMETVEGDMARLLPFFLSLLARNLNQTGVLFLLQLLDNSYVGRCLEFHLKRVMVLLLSYQGPLAFTVGTAIGQLVQRYAPKYAALRTVLEGPEEEEDYSRTLKQVGMAVRLGQPLNIDPRLVSRCLSESLENSEMAIICLRALMEHGEALGMREVMGGPMLSYPSGPMHQDPYLCLL